MLVEAAFSLPYLGYISAISRLYLDVLVEAAFSLPVLIEVVAGGQGRWDRSRRLVLVPDTRRAAEKSTSPSSPSSPTRDEKWTPFALEHLLVAELVDTAQDPVLLRLLPRLLPPAEIAVVGRPVERSLHRAGGARAAPFHLVSERERELVAAHGARGTRRD